MNGRKIFVKRMPIDSFERLRAATPVSTSDVVQIEAGRMEGLLTHIGLADVSMGLGTFNRGVTSRGIFSANAFTIGFLLNGTEVGKSQARITELAIWPPGTEHDQTYRGHVDFGGLSVGGDFLQEFLQADTEVAQALTATERHIYRPNGDAGAAQRLSEIVLRVEQLQSDCSSAAADYWKRCLVETVTSAIARTEPEKEFVPSSAKLVKKAQDFLDESGQRPIHVSEVLSHLRVSRRTLHRAFDEALGIGPITLLRYRRLCNARIALKQGSVGHRTIADIAFEHGFSDFGRFAGYYRKLFGELPSETERFA